MSEMIELILDQCLEDIRAKRLTVGDCLVKYPNYAADLGPLLEMALAIENVPDIKPSNEFKRATRDRLLRRSPPTKPDGRIEAETPSNPNSTRDGRQRNPHLDDALPLPTPRPAKQSA